MNKTIINDPYFRVEMIRCTPNPQQLCWLGMHQDYCEDFVADRVEKAPNETKSGEKVIEYNLSGNRGHYGVLEHPQITFNVGYFPHSTMQQLRTHRVGISFEVQSGRYTSKRFLDVVSGKRSVEEVFYVRPVGFYQDRKGKKYNYSEADRELDLEYCENACQYYAKKIEEGMAEEQARQIIPFDFRQHFMLTLNARSLMHILDLRWKKDAQPEIQQLSELLFYHFQNWMPEIAQYYYDKRAKKAKLSP